MEALLHNRLKHETNLILVQLAERSNVGTRHLCIDIVVSGLGPTWQSQYTVVGKSIGNFNRSAQRPAVAVFVAYPAVEEATGFTRVRLLNRDNIKHGKLGSYTLSLFLSPDLRC